MQLVEVFWIRDILVHERIRILLFSSVTYKMSTKFCLLPVLFESTITLFFKDKKS
jgi:hypothetical protein